MIQTAQPTYLIGLSVVLLIFGNALSVVSCSKLMPYDEYLQTPEWRERAAQVKMLRGKCAKCGSRERLEAHHLTYERRGHEDMADLQVLCHDCHMRTHDDHR